MNQTKILLLFLFIVVVTAGCRKETGNFSGGDNYISSFQLKLGEKVFNAAISDADIVITAPENLSLKEATATVTVSENANIDPAPASVTDWDAAQTFTVSSFNGAKRSYSYRVERNVVAKDGDVILLTQADVEELAAQNVSQINGSLTVGAATGTDSVYSLAPLSGLKSIQSGLTILATYAGEDLAGLENLTRAGSIQIQQNKSLANVSFQALTSVMSDLIINQSLMTTISFPVLENIDKGLQILSCNLLAEAGFPKLKNIVENLTLSGTSTAPLTAIDFPVLGKAGGNINISNWPQAVAVNIPLLTSTTGLTISSLQRAAKINLPALKNTWNNVTLTSLPLLTTLDLSSLRSTGGELNLNGLNQLTSTSGLKSLQTVGGRLYLSGLTAIDDPELGGLSNLNSVGGDITLSQVAFKRFSGFGLDQVNNLGIYGNNIASIEEIDVSRLDVINTLTLSNISTEFSLTGKSIFTGNLTLDNSTPATIEGFEEVNNLNYSMSRNTQPQRSLSIHKVNGNATLTVYNFSTFEMPLLEEVSGTLSLNTVTGIQTVSFPALRRAGIASLDVAILPGFSLPVLQIVDGDLSITTGKYNADNLSDLQLPALNTVNGTLSLTGYSSSYYNSKLTNLNGLTSLRHANGIVISYNMALTDYAGLKNALLSFTAAGWKVSGNGYNPSYEDMINGNYVKP